MLGQALGWTVVEGSLTFGSWNIASLLADTLGRISFYLAAVFLAAVYGWFGWLLWKGIKNRLQKDAIEPYRTRQLLLQCASLTVLVFILTNKVFSPQYLIWLCPLLPLLGGRSRYLVWSLFVVAAALTQYVFPYHYIEFELGNPVPVAMLFIRNLLLIAVAIVLLRTPPSTVTTVPSKSLPISAPPLSSKLSF